MSLIHFRKFVLWLSFLTVLLSGVTSQAQDAPVWTAIQESGLVGEVGQTQTIDNVTITLNWAYVDTQRLAVNYTIETDRNIYDLFSPYSTYPVLGDTEGSHFSYASSTFGFGESPHKQTWTVEYYSQAVRPGVGTDEWIIDNDYFANRFDTLPETIDLRFELKLGDFTVDEMFPIPPGSSLKPGDVVEPVGAFQFEFNVPLHPALTITPNQTVESKGLKMTLESVSITPVQTTTRICYDMPDSQDWMPSANLTLDGGAALLTGMSITGSKAAIGLDTKWRCRDLSFQIFHEDVPDSLTLDVGSLATSMMEGPSEWEQIKQVLEAQGIDIQVNSETSPQGGGGIGIDILKIPDGVDFNDAVDAAREQLGKIIRGPWIFTLNIS